jgi:TusA-related sulfurtransferase
MEDPVDELAETDAPLDRPLETLDARELPPPEPLQNTLERLTELPDETLLVQYNDRVPQHLFPKLDDRGYEHETVEREDDVVTAIWRP